MEVGNRVAKNSTSSPAPTSSTSAQDKSVVNEQKQNPYIDAKMTYRLDRLVERQANFSSTSPSSSQAESAWTLNTPSKKSAAKPAAPPPIQSSSSANPNTGKAKSPPVSNSTEKPAPSKAPNGSPTASTASKPAPARAPDPP